MAHPPDDQTKQTVTDNNRVENSPPADGREENSAPAQQADTPVAPPSGFQKWVVAARLFAAPASLVPVAYGAVLAYSDGLDLVWWLLIPALLAATLLHIGTNMANDYFDFKEGVDRQGTLGGSGVLVNKVIRPREVAVAAGICFGCGIAIGFYFIARCGWPMFALGVAGVAGGFLYTGFPLAYKYRAMGELGVFLLMGPLMVAGGFLAVSGVLTSRPFFAAIPVGLLVAAILAANNLRDMEMDRSAKILTVAIMLGVSGAKAFYALLVVGAHVTVPILCVLGILPWSATIALGGLIFAIPAVRRALAARSGSPDDLVDLDVATAKLHLVFGILLCLGTLFG